MRTHFPRSSCSVRDFEQTFRDSTHRCLAEGQGDGPPQDNGETFIIIIIFTLIIITRARVMVLLRIMVSNINIFTIMLA